MKPDIKKVEDVGDNVATMEPLLISDTSRHRPQLNDLAVELASKAAGFRHSLPDGVRTALADLVRSMNCYYSNLIEGHDTHPVDIERALNNDYSDDRKKRDLQREAIAHITVQKWIDEGGLAGKTTTTGGLCEIHRRFCEELPDELLWVEYPEGGERVRVVPGELRTRYVEVGQHTPVSPGAVGRFLTRFEEVFCNLGTSETIIGSAAAHHRLLWIHPFIDGNGRVARLMSHATMLDTVDSGGIWSIARGLARNVDDYKRHLAQCDLPRRNDLDGRGNLSEEALAEFTRFFLETCIDQVNFMEDLTRPDKLRTRILMWAEEEARLGNLPAKAGRILEAILYRGELPRGEAANVVGTTDRHARRFVSALTEAGVIVSKSPRSDLRLAFPAALASRWMPGLFPEQRD